MLSNLFRKIVDLTPKLSLRAWKLFYELTARLYKKHIDWKFMNYGFADIESPPTNNYGALCSNLYHHLFNKTDITGKRVLEIGCGRGGGCELVLQYNPKAVTGLDYSENVIKFCKQAYKQSN